jgi:hypothetical protein
MKYPPISIALFLSFAPLVLACAGDGEEGSGDRSGAGDGTKADAGGQGGMGGDDADAEVLYRAMLCQEICAKEATLDAETANPDGGGCGFEDTCQAALCTEGFDAECQATMTPLFECLIEADPSLFYCNGTYGVAVDAAADYDCPALASPWLNCVANRPKP